MGSVALRVLCSIERAGRWTLSGPSIRRRTGFTLIELMIVIAIIAIIAAIAIPNLLEARKSGNDSSAIGKIRTVASAQLFVRAQGSTYATLGQLGTAGLVEPALGDGAKSGYYFVGSVDPTLGTFELKASPASPNSGSKNFGMKCGADVPVECEIRESDSVFPDETDPPVPESDGDPRIRFRHRWVESVAGKGRRQSSQRTRSSRRPRIRRCRNFSGAWPSAWLKHTRRQWLAWYIRCSQPHRAPRLHPSKQCWKASTTTATTNSH
ncbi:MAG: prepilin-type N-terminal cleavage/methylation domain-containing protein [Myxococcota bacterium]